jgi:hypothetical protein
MAVKSTQIHIVLVEDNPADVVLARMTLDAVRKNEAECSYELTVLSMERALWRISPMRPCLGRIS